MARPIKKSLAIPLESFPPLPIDDEHWEAIVATMRLSTQQARILQFVLRGMCDKQIAAVLGVRESTVQTYLKRISARTRTRGRMELAMHVMSVSRRIDQ